MVFSYFVKPVLLTQCLVRADWFERRRHLRSLAPCGGLLGFRQRGLDGSRFLGRRVGLQFRRQLGQRRAFLLDLCRVVVQEGLDLLQVGLRAQASSRG